MDGQSYPIGSFLILASAFFLLSYLNRTDKPKIKGRVNSISSATRYTNMFEGIPEIPGFPFLGNLLQLGNEHAKNASELAKKHGPVLIFCPSIASARVLLLNSNLLSIGIPSPPGE